MSDLHIEKMDKLTKIIELLKKYGTLQISYNSKTNKIYIKKLQEVE